MVRESPPEPGFEPDGWCCRARIGLLVPDRDVGPESEWSAMAPAGVSVVTANSALLWHSLRTLGLPTDEVTRYGCLFGTRSGRAE